MARTFMVHALSVMVVGIASLLVLTGNAGAQETEGQPTPDQRPARLRICAITLGAPDRVVRLELPESVDGLEVQAPSANITVSIGDDGCALVENIPAGSFTYILHLASGGTVTDQVVVQPGEDGTITSSAVLPQPGQLPPAGSGAGSASSNLSTVLLFAGLASLVCGALAFAVVRRRAG